MSVAELMEQGIRAFTRGETAEAERLWREVLRLDPFHDRAQSYLSLVEGRRGVAIALPAPAPASAPAPAAAPGRGPSPERAHTPPVPLPAPARQTGPAWMRPPITLSPTVSPVPPASEAPQPPAPAAPRETRIDRPTLSDYAPSPWDQGPAVAPAVVLDEGDGLDLSSVEEQSDVRPLVPEVTAPIELAAAPRRTRSDVEVWLEGAKELFALGDFSGSLEMIEKILKIDPSHAEARRYLEQNEATLIAMYESKLGPASAVPRLAIQPEEVMWLNLDHRAGFLLAQIDGSSTYEDLFALSGLPRLDTARILAALMQEGVITS